MLPRVALILLLVLMLTACASEPAPPVSDGTPVAGHESPGSPPATDPPVRTFGPVPEILARPVTEGGPQQITFTAGDAVSKVGAYFLNVETGEGEGWLFPVLQNSFWIAPVISHDNRFVQRNAEGVGYLIDRQSGAVWQWDAETAELLLTTDQGFLFAEMERKDLNPHQTGRYFWTGPDFKPLRTFILDEGGSATAALLSPDGQQLALLTQGPAPALLLLNLGRGAQESRALPGAGAWIGASGMLAKNGYIQITTWVSEGSPSTSKPRWRQLIRLYDWQGRVQQDLEIPGTYAFSSPDGRWLAWQEPDLIGDLAPVTVLAEAATMRPVYRVLGASTCFASLGSGGSRWLADSSGLVLSTTDDQYQILTTDGDLLNPPGFAGRSWKGEPQPAPDKVDRVAFGRLQVQDGDRQLAVTLEGYVSPRADHAWGSSGQELRFSLPPKPAGGACYELPAMESLVLKADQPVPEFPLVVRSGDSLSLQHAGQADLHLPAGTRLKPLSPGNSQLALTWSDAWRLHVATESGQTGWITLSGDPLTWVH